MMTHVHSIREICGLVVQSGSGTTNQKGWNICGLYLCEGLKIAA